MKKELSNEIEYQKIWSKVEIKSIESEVSTYKGKYLKVD
jgi:hypothetical protein